MRPARLIPVGLLLALVASPASLIAPATAAPAATLHEDYPRTDRDDAALRFASQAVVDACLKSTLLLLRQEHAPAREAANQSAQFGGRLVGAAQQPLGSVERPPLLYALAPPSGELGGAMGGLADDVRLLESGTLGRGAFIFHKGQALQTIGEMVENATTLGGYGVTTQPLIDALRDLLAVVLRLEPPPAEAPPDPKGGAPEALAGVIAQGPGQSPGSDQSQGWVLLADPNPAWFGQDIRITVVQAGVTGTMRVDVFGASAQGQMAGGFGRVTVRVPWSVATGPHQVRASWPGQTAEGTLHVIRVPTSFGHATFHEGTPGQLVFSARLTDAGARDLFPATVAWAAGGLSGAIATDFMGRVGIPLPNGTERVTLHYDGNRTHAPADLEGTAPTTAAYLPVVPMARPDAFPWWLLLLILLFLIVAIALWRARHRLRRRQAPPPIGVTAPLAAYEPRPGQPALGLDHPLIRALEKAGYPARTLTLREAGPLWVALGAPQVWPFVQRQEESFYQNRTAAPLPRELMQWALAHS